MPTKNKFINRLLILPAKIAKSNSCLIKEHITKLVLQIPNLNNTLAPYINIYPQKITASLSCETMKMENLRCFQNIKIRFVM